MKLKKDLETMTSEREMTETALRKRHQDAINELSQQLETSNRIRTKYVPYTVPYPAVSYFKLTVRMRSSPYRCSLRSTLTINTANTLTLAQECQLS